METRGGAGRGWRALARAVHAVGRRRRSGAEAGAADLEGWEPLWRAAAAELGAEVEDLGAGFLEIRRGGQRTRVRHHLVKLGDPVTLKLARSQPLARRLLARACLPVPACETFGLDTLARAEAFRREHGGTCVVKPVPARGGGAGVTAGVDSRRGLRRAALRAALVARGLLVEEHVPGDAYRLLYLEGELLDAERRRPRAREPEPVRAAIGKDLRAEGARAAQLLGARLARVHVITPDPGASLLASGGRICRVDPTPALAGHGGFRNPAASLRVAVPLLARLLG